MEDHRKKRGERQEVIEKFSEEKKCVQHELELSLRKSRQENMTKKKLRKMKAQGGTDQLEDEEDGDDRQGKDSMELEDSLEGVPEDTELSQDAPP